MADGESSSNLTLSAMLCGWRAMPLWAKFSLALGLAGLLVFDHVQVSGLTPTTIAVIRIGCLILFVAGAITSALARDEFYQRAYLLGCAFSVVVSSVVLYSLALFGIDLGSRAVSVIIGAWFIGFVISFYRLRHA